MTAGALVVFSSAWVHRHDPPLGLALGHGAGGLATVAAVRRHAVVVENRAPVVVHVGPALLVLGDPRQQELRQTHAPILSSSASAREAINRACTACQHRALP